MVSRFLLHDAADMSIGGISGKRKFSLWGGMLEGHRRGQGAFSILESFLCCSGPLQYFGPLPQEISQRAQHLCAIRQKTAVKMHYAGKTLQLLNVLRGGA
jgi:hypothetical protein